jgi:hypothetical protein
MMYENDVSVQHSDVLVTGTGTVEEIFAVT